MLGHRGKIRKITTGENGGSLEMYRLHFSEGTSAALQSKKKFVVTALTMVIDFAPIPIISQ
jgi:hypothetical protein